MSSPSSNRFSKNRAVILTLAAVVVFQSASWLTAGRNRLIARVVLDEMERSAQMAKTRELSSGEAFQFLVPSDEVLAALKPSELERFKALLAQYASTKVVSRQEWSRHREGLDPEEQWNLHARTECWRVVPNINLPLIANVECDDMCGDVAWHGHTHWYAYVLGAWIHIHQTGDWVS